MLCILFGVSEETDSSIADVLDVRKDLFWCFLLDLIMNPSNFCVSGGYAFLILSSIWLGLSCCFLKLEKLDLINALNSCSYSFSISDRTFLGTNFILIVEVTNLKMAWLKKRMSQFSLIIIFPFGSLSRSPSRNFLVFSFVLLITNLSLLVFSKQEKMNALTTI